MKKKFVSIQAKIYRISFLMISVGSILCSFGTFGVLYRDILEKTKMDYQAVVNNVAWAFNSNIEDIIRCSEQIITNQSMISYLQNMFDGEQNYQYFLARSNIDQDLKSAAAMNSGLVENITIIDRNGERMSYGMESFDTPQIPVSEMQEMRGFYRHGEALFYSCPFVGSRPDEAIGMLLIDIREKEFWGALDTLDDSSLYIQMKDGQGSTIADSGVQDGNWEFIGQQTLVSGWQMSASINRDILADSLRSALFMILGILVSVLAVSYLLFRPVLRRITEPLVALTKEIKEFRPENDNEIVLTEISNDEIGTIAREYERMVRRIRRLVLRLKKQKETEVHLYMSQVNPHFIYNTLYALICVAEKKNEPEIAEKIRGVADILCLSLYSGPESTHPIKTEMDAINQYLDILKYKYGEGIHVRWILKPGMEEKEIHVLLLYPLVENAVFHGLSQAKEKCLTIKIGENDREEFFEVEDNGTGMSQEEIYAIYDRFEQWRDRMGEEDFDEEQENTCMGLFNLMLRLFFLYGEKARLEIKSAKGKGTRAIIRIKNN